MDAGYLPWSCEAVIQASQISDVRATGLKENDFHKGFVLDDERLKTGQSFLVKIFERPIRTVSRDTRLSERWY